MVHNNPTMLNCFIKQLLQYQGSVVFIHVDEKGLNIIPDIIEDPRVIIIPEHYNGSWGDYSQIQMVNALIKNAVNSGDFDYYSLHSGVDLCVREVSEFADYLSKNNLYGFYECTKLPSTWQYGGGLGRVALKWPKYLRRRAVGYAIYIIDILIKNPNVRSVKVNCTLYAYFQRSGSLVSGISVDLVRHLADYTMQKLVNLEDENLKGILAEDVIKRMLYVRYYYLLKKERIAAAECNEVIRSMLTLLSHRKVKYVVLYLIPELYRQFRLRNDPSMKTFEKNVKSSDHHCL